VLATFKTTSKFTQRFNIPSDPQLTMVRTSLAILALGLSSTLAAPIFPVFNALEARMEEESKNSNDQKSLVRSGSKRSLSIAIPVNKVEDTTPSSRFPSSRFKRAKSFKSFPFDEEGHTSAGKISLFKDDTRLPPIKSGSTSPTSHQSSSNVPDPYSLSSSLGQLMLKDKGVESTSENRPDTPGEKVLHKPFP